MSGYLKNPGNCYQHHACVCYHGEIARLKAELKNVRKWQNMEAPQKVIRAISDLSLFLNRAAFDLKEADEELSELIEITNNSSPPVAAAEKKKGSRPRRALKTRR